MARFEVLIITLFALIFVRSCASLALKSRREPRVNATSEFANCACGVFLTGQMVRNVLASQSEVPPIMMELEDPITCSSLGAASDCSRKCVEEMVKYLPNSAKLICSSIDRDVTKEKAHLFINVCNQGWVKTKLSTSKQVCCKDSLDYKC